MNSLRRNNDVQVLRAFAIIMVVVTHLKPLHPYLPDAFVHGATGVNLFFVISGFVITLSSMRMTMDDFTVVFLIKRFFRIVPVAGFWLAIYAIFFGILHALGAAPDVMPQVWAIVTFRYNYLIDQTGPALGHYWSLMVEEHFYFGFAFLFPFLARRRLFVPAMLLISVVTISYLRPYAGKMGYTQACLDYFAMGAIVAYAANAAAISISRWLLVGLSSILTIAIWVLFSQTVARGHDLLLILSVALVYIASADRNVVAPVPYMREALIWIGERSYSLYLAHPLMIYVDAYVATYLHAYMAIGLLPRAAIVICASLIVGHLSHDWLEVPFDRLGKSITARLFSQQIAVVAPSFETAYSSPKVDPG